MINTLDPNKMPTNGLDFDIAKKGRHEANWVIRQITKTANNIAEMSQNYNKESVIKCEILHNKKTIFSGTNTECKELTLDKLLNSFDSDVCTSTNTCLDAGVTITGETDCSFTVSISK
jgi:hypothetical protein